MKVVHNMDPASQRRCVGVGEKTLFVPAVGQRQASSVGESWWNVEPCGMSVDAGAGVVIVADSVTMRRCRRTGSYSPVVGKSPFPYCPDVKLNVEKGRVCVRVRVR